MKKFINSKTEHNKVLFELHLLDDTDDYNLFRQLPDDSAEIDLETWLKYCNKARHETKNGKL